MNARPQRDEKQEADRGAFVGLFIATGAAMLGLSIIIPIMPLYAEHLGASGFFLGVIFSGFALSRGLFAPIMGRVSDQYGRKRLLMLGLGLYVLLALAYAFAASPLVLAGIRLAQGFASVLVTPIAQSYIGDITPEGREGEYMNLFYVSLFGGLAVGPLIGGWLSDVFALQTPFFFMAAMAAVAFVLVAVMVPQRLAAAREEQRGAPVSMRRALAAVFGDDEMRGLMSYIGARGFYRWGFNSFFPIFAVGAAALNRTQVGLLISGYMLAGGVLQYPLGRLSDRFPERRVAFIVFGGTLSGLAMLVLTMLHSLYPLIALVVGMGVTSAVSRAASVAIRTERGRVHGMGAVTGAFTTSMSAGQVFGPLLFGAVIDLFSIQAAFYLGGIVGLAGTAGAWWFLHKAEREAEAKAVGKP